MFWDSEILTGTCLCFCLVDVGLIGKKAKDVWGFRLMRTWYFEGIKLWLLSLWLQFLQRPFSPQDPPGFSLLRGAFSSLGPSQGPSLPKIFSIWNPSP